MKKVSYKPSPDPEHECLDNLVQTSNIETEWDTLYNRDYSWKIQF